MTIGGLAGMAVTTPLGALADATRRKRLLLALASTGIVAALALIFLCQHPLLVGCARSSRPSARRPWPRPSAA